MRAPAAYAPKGLGTLLLIILVVVGGFYGLNHLLMSMQGLPLNLDLSPASNTVQQESPR